MITQVSSKLLRCNRADVYANKARFESEGVGTIISFEGLEEDFKEQDFFRDPPNDPKGKVVIPVISCPIDTWQIIVTGISQADFSYNIDLMINSAGVVVAHCRQNHDRTGLHVAGYRVRKQGWTKDAAMKEAKAFGYSWKNFGLNKTWAGFNG